MGGVAYILDVIAHWLAKLLELTSECQILATLKTAVLGLLFTATFNAKIRHSKVAYMKSKNSQFLKELRKKAFKRDCQNLGEQNDRGVYRAGVWDRD